MGRGWLNMAGKLLRTAISPEILVTVTDEHIKSAKRCDGFKCMISEALSDSFPRATYIRVDLQSVRFTDLEKGVKYRYFTPLKAAMQLIAWDKGTAVKPFSFRLKDAQVRLSGWMGQRSPGTVAEKHHRKAVGGVKAAPSLRFRKFGMCLLER